MTAWVADGSVKYREDVVEGLENAPGALIGLFGEKNFRKLVVRVGNDESARSPRAACELSISLDWRPMKILMILTSHDKLGNTGGKTGFWLEEFTSPYYVFKDAGADVTLASVKGGQPPLDPKSDDPSAQTESTERFKRDKATQAALAATLKLEDVKETDYDAVFYPGGHGPLWDLAEDKRSIALIEAFWKAGKPVSAVCHAPGALRHVQIDGTPLVRGKHVTGFTNSEEAAVHLAAVVPFLVEDELKRRGGIYTKAADWQSYVRVDGNLITGQNPASSSAVATEVLKLLR